MSTLILQEMKTNWVENENTLGYTKQATYSIQHCSLGKEVLGKLEKGNSEDKQQVQRLVIAAEACPAWPCKLVHGAASEQWPKQCLINYCHTSRKHVLSMPLLVLPFYFQTIAQMVTKAVRRPPPYYSWTSYIISLQKTKQAFQAT